MSSRSSISLPRLACTIRGKQASCFQTIQSRTFFHPSLTSRRNDIFRVHTFQSQHLIPRITFGVRSYISNASDEVEDLLVKNWKQTSLFNISLKFPEGWDLTEEADNSFHFRTRRGHIVSCLALEKDSKWKSASQGAQHLFQMKEFSNPTQMKTQMGNVNGSEGDTFESFELEFQTEDKSNWIVALDDERHGRLLLWHFESPISDFDKGLYIVFLSTINTKTVSRERVEAVVEDPSDYGAESGSYSHEDRVSSEHQRGSQSGGQSYSQSQEADPFRLAGKWRKYMKGIDMTKGAFTSENMDTFKQMIQDPEISDQLRDLSRKTFSLTTEDFDRLRNTEEYKNSKEIRDFVEDYSQSHFGALLKYSNSEPVKAFIADRVFPIIMTK